MSKLILQAQDTIVARATPPGPGGIAIVRISGPKAHPVGRALFRPSGGRMPEPRRLAHGHVIDPADAAPVDEVLCAFFEAPHSYTTEDAVEIQGHGGPALTARVIELALAQGCRAATAGEFTLRAMLGGRLDLSRAEAVGELVAARSRAEATTALSLLEGGLSRRLEPVRRALLEVAASVEAAIDFPEDVDELAGEAQAEALRRGVCEPLDELISGSMAGRAFREGAVVVICGRPNVGKSSLFNAFLGRRRTIVSDIPGTTRDSVDEFVVLGGVACRLVDTAGLGPLADELDALGQDDARARLNVADLALVLLDSSTPLLQADWALLEQTEGLNRLVARNKADLEAAWGADALPQGTPVLDLSAKFGQGLGALARAVGNAVCHGAPEPGPDDIVVGSRQRHALERCAAAAARAAAHLGGPDAPAELAGLDLAQALASLGEVDGQGAPDEVIEAVFARFCVGK